MAYPADSDMPVVEKHFLASPLRNDPWLAAVLACFSLFAWANWGKFEFPIVDIGREIEIPARLVAGQLLYRDVETYYGPLAYYANALALLLFGHRLEVFYIVGLALALAATLLFYRLAKQLTNARWAALCTVCMQIYCTLGPGLFNFILPYSYGAVYATVLCLLAVAALDRYGYTGRTGWLIAAAIACGLAGLAKQEYGVAALGGVLVGANLYYPQNIRTRVGYSVLVLVVASACVLLPLTLIAQQVSWEKLYQSLFPVSKAGLLNRSSLFQVSPVKTLYIWWISFRVFATASLVIWGSMVAAHWLSKFRWMPNSRWIRVSVEVLAAIAFALVGMTLLRSISRHYSSDFFHPLGDLSWCIPLLVGWLALMRPQFAQSKQASLVWTLLVFSLLLNARWLFYINFYGLYATPVVLLFFTMLYHLAQRVDALVWRYLLICLLIGSSMKLGDLAQYSYAVYSSHGTLYTRDAAVARAFNQTIQAINASKATSVLVLPEGSILTFLTATHSPSREITFLPIALPTSEAEREFLARMQANPPDLIVYIDRSFPEWGYQTYAEFNPLVDHWITQQHRLVDFFPKDEGAIRIYARD